MKIFCFSGLGADWRVFDNLKLDDELIHLPWLDYSSKKSLKEYAEEYIPLLPQNEKFALLGVSFGAAMAVEISQMAKPEFTILISNIEKSDEMPFLYSWLAKSKIIHLIPASIFIPPFAMAKYFFRPKDQELLKQIIKDSDPKFNKWALMMLLNWDNKKGLNRVLKIHGAEDKLFPLPNDPNIKVIIDAGHFMVHDCGIEVSQIINDYSKSTKNS
tara:strand:- start:147995 stop:148639 length:645 start_codon:yes stop_codon:yes gene_type:complete